MVIYIHQIESISALLRFFLLFISASPVPLQERRRASAAHIVFEVQAPIRRRRLRYVSTRDGGIRLTEQINDESDVGAGDGGSEG